MPFLLVAAPPCSCRCCHDELLAAGSTRMSLPADATDEDIIAATNDEFAAAKEIIATMGDIATAMDNLANCNRRGACHRRE